MDVILLPAFNFCFFSMFALLNFEIATVHTYVTLNFQPEIVRMHQNINITCTVHGIDNINNKLTRQWSKGPDLICYNGHPIDSSKYTETLPSGNQFILQIRNVTESDVNCKYQCRYGFEAQAKSIQFSKENFEYPPAKEVRAIVQINETDRRLTVNLHFKKVFPLPTCTALIGGSICSFNITSSQSFGNYYEVILRHQSLDRLPCNADVIVKCKLIHEYTIPTEDLRACSLKENPSKESRLVLLGVFIPIILLIVLLVFLIISYRMKTSHVDGWEIANCHKLGRPCLTTSKGESNSISRMSSSTSNMSNINSDESLDLLEACLEREKESEIAKSQKLGLSYLATKETEKHSYA
ncbi:uncharacterized protein LOC127717957 isoform X2 [Mytilus californianus]|uniref:uncharacterized protein LOC127717957 isoform X2 n=1 Tax=Mytilus californianus TaxID=6549 RepID=UPI0022465248|nr:uncharacterized protein LOC127717957 isoform X2 [Mytilus californianus]